MQYPEVRKEFMKSQIEVQTAIAEKRKKNCEGTDIRKMLGDIGH